MLFRSRRIGFLECVSPRRTDVCVEYMFHPDEPECVSGMCFTQLGHVNDPPSHCLANRGDYRGLEQALELRTDKLASRSPEWRALLGRMVNNLETCCHSGDHLGDMS